MKCPSYEECVNGTKYENSASILLLDKFAEDNYSTSVLFDENNEPSVCRLEDGIVFNTGLSIMIFIETHR